MLLNGRLCSNEYDALKARDHIVWVGAMNNIPNAAEEIVLSELIYC